MDTITDLIEDAKRDIGGGRPWNPYTGAFVPYLREDPAARLTYQRDRAAYFLAQEITKMAPVTYLQPVPARVKLLKKCLRLATRRLADYLRFRAIVRRCELKPISAAYCGTMVGKQAPKDTVVIYYNGSGVIGLVHGRIQSEMVLTTTVWKMRRADSELQFITRMYGDLVCHLG